MTYNKIILTLSLVIFSFAGCASFKDPDVQRFIVSTGTDMAVAGVIAKHPEFTPYAEAVSQIIKTGNLTPDGLDSALDLFVISVAADASKEQLDSLFAVTNVIKRNYRLYFKSRKVEMLPGDYALSLSDQLKTQATNK